MRALFTLTRVATCFQGLPEGVSGEVRVVSIDGVDKNLCCGTHVPSLAHLGGVKLLRLERVKAMCVVEIRSVPFALWGHCSDTWLALSLSLSLSRSLSFSPR